MVSTAPPLVQGRRSSLQGRSRRGASHGRWREVTANQLFLVPIGIVFLWLFVIPLGQTFYYSFTDFTGYSTDVAWVGGSNYAKIFNDSSMLAGLAFTLLFAVGTTVIITAFAIPLAVILNRRFIGRNFVRSVFFFPAIPSIAILGLVWGYILSPLGSGVLNSVLDALFSVGPFPWLSDSTLARISVIVVAVWAGTGWHAVLYLAYLQSIPADYYEVATIDGASARQRFQYITLPLLTPAIVISQFLLMTGGLKVYDLPFTLTSGGPGYATYTLTQAIITSGVAQGRYGLASALAVLFTIAVAVLVLAQLGLSRLLERRIS
ncbi:carbohydrate ABC transporter permease [Occultella kanbiaonis]|uniref:carbohydrate ABC transporter permease n=1 Tax=Occultella kanbiaonis TaxID=2675754 RepID=UPI0013D071D6|nr:sugar ABC transporter permease [Occultella kanbiaonis]